MIRSAFSAILLITFAGLVYSQTATPTPPRQTPAPQTRPTVSFERSEYGVALQPDARLIVMMAALDAAGIDPTPSGKEPSAFRTLIRKDQANLDAGLRQRLTTFYER